VFSPTLTIPGMSFAVALRGRTEKQPQPETHQVAVAGPATLEPRVPAALPQHDQQITGKSVRAPQHSRRVLRGGAPRQDRGTAAAWDTSGVSGRPRHNRTQGPCGLTPTWTADNRSVSSGPECKQFASGLNVEGSSNSSTADCDRV
jgi:hypothetical protein